MAVFPPMMASAANEPFMSRQELKRPTQNDDCEALVAPAECRKMADVRFEIDRLDRLLVGLMAARQSYIEAAARIKTREDEVRLEWRIEDVVAKVLRAAEAQGLSKRIAEPVWRELIDRCIAHEQEFWRRTRAKDEG